jgi:hypothetical protein
MRGTWLMQNFIFEFLSIINDLSFFFFLIIYIVISCNDIFKVHFIFFCIFSIFIFFSIIKSIFSLYEAFLTHHHHDCIMIYFLAILINKYHIVGIMSLHKHICWTVLLVYWGSTHFSVLLK